MADAPSGPVQLDAARCIAACEARAKRATALPMTPPDTPVAAMPAAVPPPLRADRGGRPGAGGRWPRRLVWLALLSLLLHLALMATLLHVRRRVPEAAVAPSFSVMFQPPSTPIHKPEAKQPTQLPGEIVPSAPTPPMPPPPVPNTAPPPPTTPPPPATRPPQPMAPTPPVTAPPPPMTPPPQPTAPTPPVTAPPPPTAAPPQPTTSSPHLSQVPAPAAPPRSLAPPQPSAPSPKLATTPPTATPPLQAAPQAPSAEFVPSLPTPTQAPRRPVTTAPPPRSTTPAQPATALPPAVPTPTAPAPPKPAPPPPVRLSILPPQFAPPLFAPAPPVLPPRRAPAFPRPMNTSLNSNALSSPARRAVRGTGAVDLSLGRTALNSNGAPPRDDAAKSGDIIVHGAHVGKDWEELLREWWAQHGYYPDEAARQGQDGTVAVHVRVDRYGNVHLVELESSSGSQWLDMGAQATFRGAHLPPFPPSTPEPMADLDITIHYILLRH